MTDDDLGDSDADEGAILRLPDELRTEFKDPLGPVYTDADELLADAGSPLVAVGDVVTYHIRESGTVPDVAVVDGYTERERATETIREVVMDADRRVANPAATLTLELLRTLHDAISSPDPTTIVVDGEEDLATLAAILAVPEGGSVVYGQPGEGMVLVSVDAAATERAGELFDGLTGDHRRAYAALGVEDR